ncbi:hypothetical protein [Luteipulveratus halotolerans]|uniref:Uncharacterized protein n=1 Tax=Luteipulveratus halotolerans TaxID=1631356 RepID=A0A0L6CHZ1_9MICO|nr:hypothetical protein [Luteipulveratus halotolerans]KNX37421.1 hypothetical protein VV01_10135 [Luteipulveratus halotolerans]
MRLPGVRRTPRLSDEATAALDLARGERVIAFAVDDNTGASVVATTWHLAAVSSAHTLLLRRPWHEVGAGQWSADTWTLSVTWTDRTQATQWTFAQQDLRLMQAFRERVEATVVVTEPLGLTGARRSGRVVLRKDLATQELFVQTVLGRGTPADDPDVQAAAQRVGARLKEQVGL